MSANTLAIRDDRSTERPLRHGDLGS
jgi:hypothetical protein